MARRGGRGGRTAAEGISRAEVGTLPGHVFVPRGDTALTRALLARGAVRVVGEQRGRVVQLGVAATPEALAAARVEVEATAGERAVSRERSRVRREREEAEYRADFARAIERLYPSIPAVDRDRVVARATEVSSKRVGRSAAAKALADEPVRLAVRAWIRHGHTDYDRRLDRAGAGKPFGRAPREAKQEARRAIRPQVDAVDRAWSRPRAGDARGPSTDRARCEPDPGEARGPGSDRARSEPDLGEARGSRTDRARSEPDPGEARGPGSDRARSEPGLGDSREARQEDGASAGAPGPGERPERSAAEFGARPARVAETTSDLRGGALEPAARAPGPTAAAQAPGPTAPARVPGPMPVARAPGPAAAARASGPAAGIGTTGARRLDPAADARALGADLGARGAAHAAVRPDLALPSAPRDASATWASPSAARPASPARQAPRAAAPRTSDAPSAGALWSRGLLRRKDPVPASPGGDPAI